MRGGGRLHRVHSGAPIVVRVCMQLIITMRVNVFKWRTRGHEFGGMEIESIGISILYIIAFPKTFPKIPLTKRNEDV